MLERSITKALAGLEDLLFGRGSVTQARAGGSYVINKLSVPWVLTDAAELGSLDHDKHPFVIVVDSSQRAVLYEYVVGTGYTEVLLANAQERPTAGFYQTASATTSIITIGVPTKVQGTTAPSEIVQGFSHTSGRLVNTTGKTVQVNATATVVVEESNLEELHFWLARSGELINSSRVILPSSTDTAPRSATLSAVISLAPNQHLEIYGANMTTLDNFVAASHSMVLS